MNLPVNDCTCTRGESVPHRYREGCDLVPYTLVSGAYGSWGWVCHECSERAYSVAKTVEQAMALAEAHQAQAHASHA